MFKKKQMDGDRWAVVLVSFDGKEEYLRHASMQELVRKYNPEEVP